MSISAVRLLSKLLSRRVQHYNLNLLQKKKKKKSPDVHGGDSESASEAL